MRKAATRNIFINSVFSILIACLMLACKKDAVNTPGSDLKDPIIETGDFFDQSNWNDPHVLYVDGKSIMYASATRNLNMDIKIYRMESNDGIHWQLQPKQAVFERSSNQNDWDSKSVETPAVVYYKGEYHLFYTGYKTIYSDGGNFKIGHCVSKDGIHWKRDYKFLLRPTSPTLIPNYDFNQYIVAEPGPVVCNDKLLLYFTTIGYDKDLANTLQTIGLVTYDGKGWSPPQEVLRPDQKQYPRNQFVGFSTPNAMVKNGKVHLYVDVVKDNPWQQVKLHRAISADGVNNFIMDSTAVLSKEDYEWTQGEIRSPSALEVDGKTYLYFAGHTDIKLCIGLKKLEE